MMIQIRANISVIFLHSLLLHLTRRLLPLHTSAPIQVCRCPHPHFCSVSDSVIDIGTSRREERTVCIIEGWRVQDWRNKTSDWPIRYSTALWLADKTQYCPLIGWWDTVLPSDWLIRYSTALWLATYERSVYTWRQRGTGSRKFSAKVAQVSAVWLTPVPPPHPGADPCWHNSAPRSPRVLVTSLRHRMSPPGHQVWAEARPQLSDGPRHHQPRDARRPEAELLLITTTGACDDGQMWPFLERFKFVSIFYFEKRQKRKSYLCLLYRTRSSSSDFDEMTLFYYHWEVWWFF